MLTAFAAAAATVPFAGDLGGRGTTAAAAGVPTPACAGTDAFCTNTGLYRNTLYTEGDHWARRYHRSGGVAQPGALSTFPATAVIAPHGGCIEPGTSELCLAVAGYRPEDATAVAGTPQYDYWMFEALRTGFHDALHITSTHCDDPAALAIVGGSAYAVSLHGRSDLPPSKGPAKQVLIGGADTVFMQRVHDTLVQYRNAVGLTEADVALNIGTAGVDEDVNGNEPDNICNRTYTRGGVQLEMTTSMRSAMFGDFSSITGRRRSYGKAKDGAADATTARYWNFFVNGLREAIAANERGAVIPL
ncbi:hypothetical protein GCM10023235_76470 [Kitasatospora terrestris]|uniref:Phage replication protein n=1 Tax=Kitasatospora terrestris TaxID=258051 RepID=A0ABP9EZ41_9ACTN